MTRIWLGAFLFAVFVGAAFYAGVRWAGQDERETQLEREKDIGDAINSCADLPWFERLHCDK